ncbi:MAG: enoyl-CoA hydratase/isomerase family protein [Candidimonas sp.]|nr:MAG: enoyl-CoA hydratase/isomerase family protein [Candidimonas sp.]TAM23573.1 MAG: enoyl-CoA hydratase/isomerase family protein [Candidimonas sp.]TAM77292.1 MAG: enoyl-CoA hydratase/isomerase family protein [Candidimonas sp.]
MPSITSSQDNNVLVLTIENEAKRNAFTHPMALELGRRLSAAEADANVRCIVITGAGDNAFSSGHDLRGMLADREHASDPLLNEPFLLPATLTTPTIAAINGYAFAAGFILAISCDLRICAANASFSAPGARIGLLPIGGQISRLPLLIPRGVAHDLLITGREMNADEAFRIGFANRLVATGDALRASLEMASIIASNSAGVVRAVKAGLETLSAQGTVAAAQFEWDRGRELQSTPDADEGMRAFLEKRPPKFL